jgi:hypothetical protein
VGTGLAYLARIFHQEGCSLVLVESVPLLATNCIFLVHNKMQAVGGVFDAASSFQPVQPENLVRILNLRQQMSYVIHNIQVDSIFCAVLPCVPP